MTYNIIFAAVGIVAGVFAIWLLLLLPRMWEEQKKINALLRRMKEENTDD